KLEPRHVLHLLDEMESRGKSEKRRQNVFVTLRAALNWGASVEGGQLIDKVATDRMKGPQPKKREMRTYNADQVRRFLTAVRATDDWIGPLCIVAIQTGMRQGELLGLRWSNVDLTNKVIHVREQLAEVDSKNAEGERELVFFGLQELKTDAGRRDVHLSDEA